MTTARLSTPLTREGRARLVDALATWDFKPHYLDDDDLFRVACILFEMALSIEGLAELDIDKGHLLAERSLSICADKLNRCSQTPPFRPPRHLSRTKPLPQLRACCRRPAGDLHVPHQYRRRSTLRLPPRLDA